MYIINTTKYNIMQITNKLCIFQNLKVRLNRLKAVLFLLFLSPYRVNEDHVRLECKEIDLHTQILRVAVGPAGGSNAQRRAIQI